MKFKITNMLTCVVFSLILFTSFVTLNSNASPVTAAETSGSPCLETQKVVNEVKTFSFTLNNEAVDLNITAILSNGNIEHKLDDEISTGSVYELKDNKLLVSLYDYSNVVLIDFENNSVSTIFGNPDSLKEQADYQLYGVVWADVLEVLPDKEHVVFYTTRSSDFKIYQQNIKTGQLFEIPADKYNDILSWFDSTTAFIAEGLSDLSREQYTLVKYNFETRKRTVIKTISSHHIQSMTLNKDNLGV